MRPVVSLFVLLLAFSGTASVLVGCEAEAEPVHPETAAEREARERAAYETALDSLLAPYGSYRSDWAAPSEAEVMRWADSVLTTLSLDQKLGQLFVVDLNANWLVGAGSLERVARDWHIGGFHVPRRMDPRLVLNHTNRLQRVAAVPLFFTADYERGVGQASNNFAELPAAMAFGAAGQNLLAEAAGAVSAIEARATGVNVLFAPVADVNNNPDNPIINTRSFGERPALVGRLAAAYTRGAQAHGALATLKHFPGHGDTTTDTHVAFGTVSGTEADLWQTELAPYQTALAADPGFIMTAHLWVQALDSEQTPATFSRRALTEILRDSLGYDGVVTTDAIHMGALKNNYSFTERMVRPIEAGADLILNTYDPRRGIRTLKNAVRDGRITEARIDQSVRRILRAKARLGLHRERLASRERLEALLSSVRGARVAQAAADASITLLEAGESLPIASGSRVALVQLTNQPGAGTRAAMSRLEGVLDEAVALRSHRGANRSAALTNAAWADVVVLALHLRVRQGAGASLDDAEQRVAEAVLESGRPVVLVLFGNPYASLDLPTPDALVVAYDPSRRSVAAAANVMLGRQAANGRLPVSVPGRYVVGSGLERAANPSPSPVGGPTPQ